jgi:hypothetical protein
MLGEDCRQFLKFVQERDPGMVVLRDSSSPEIQIIRDPSARYGLYCLWNQALLPSIQLKFVPRSKGAPFNTIDPNLPVIEFSFPSAVPTTWNGRPSLIQGRVWQASRQRTRIRMLVQRYRALDQKEFRQEPRVTRRVCWSFRIQWYMNGGILLPAFLPPLTPQWMSWLEAQDQHRAVFGR